MGADFEAVVAIMSDNAARTPYDLSGYESFRFIAVSSVPNGTTAVDLDSEADPVTITRADDADGKVVLIFSAAVTATLTQEEYPATLWGVDDTGRRVVLLLFKLKPVLTAPYPA